MLNTQSASTPSSKQGEPRPPQLNFYLHIIYDVIEGLTGVAVPTVHVLPTGITPSIGIRMNVGVAQGERTLLAEIIYELDALKRRADNLADYSFRPTKHAFRSARFYIFETYAKMGDAFPRPSFVLDGAKGIVLKWFKNGYIVRLNCLPSQADSDYIYFENGEYDVEDNVTVDILSNRLNWLIHEREPAR
jgi:hypothetical protein